MKIYTRVGDDGGTGLIGGGRVSKDHLRIEAYGTLDELSATIGMACSQPLSAAIGELLRTVQDDLFVMGAQLATPGGGTPSCGSITQADVQRIEASIDRFEAELSPLRTFILPGGSPAAAALHLSRVVCRRAERRVVSLSGQEAVAEALVPYLNRLSDLFFVLSRVVNREANIEDTPWRKREMTPEIEES
jgi:cob(I)alamin adenosyltransferase